MQSVEIVDIQGVLLSSHRKSRVFSTYLAVHRAYFHSAVVGVSPDLKLYQALHLMQTAVETAAPTQSFSDPIIWCSGADGEAGDIVPRKHLSVF